MEPCLGILENLSHSMSPETSPSGTTSPQNDAALRFCTETPAFFTSTLRHRVQVVNFCLTSHLKDQITEDQFVSARSPTRIYPSGNTGGRICSSV